MVVLFFFILLLLCPVQCPQKVTNEDAFVPVFEEKIISKVLRITWYDGKMPAQGGANKLAGAAAEQASKPPPPPAPAPPPTDMLGFGDSNPSPARAQTSPSPPAPPAPAAGKGDDFDMLFT